MDGFLMENFMPKSRLSHKHNPFESSSLLDHIKRVHETDDFHPHLLNHYLLLTSYKDNQKETNNETKTF